MSVAKLAVLDVFLDDSADALAGGNVYTYIAGTSTPLATYTDNTGDTANTNPVVLDAAGRAHIWFTEGSSYKVVVKDANGVTVYTEDGITIAGSAISTVTYVDIGFEVLDNDPPTSSQILGSYPFTEGVNFAANFAGSQGKITSAGTNPAGTFTAIVKKNGAQVGTMVISTGGAFTFATTGGATVSFSTDDVLEVFGPAVADSSLLLFAFTFRGTAA